MQGFIKSSMNNWLMEEIFSFSPVISPVLHPVQKPPVQERHEPLGGSWGDPWNYWVGWNNVYEERLTELVLFGLEKRILQGHFVVDFQYLKEASKTVIETLFTRDCSKKSRGNSFNLKECMFGWDIKRIFQLWGLWDTGMGSSVWKCSNSGRTELWGTWSSGMHSCPWQAHWTR